MPPVRVDQVIPSLASRDAIGVHTVAITERLRQVGIDSDIFYGECTRDLADRARPMSSLGRPTKGGGCMYQASIGSPVFDIFASRSEPKLLNYHNITPATLLDGWEPAVGHEVSLGRSQVTRVADECRLAIADSAFNEEELIDVGFEHTAVAPLLIDMTAAAQPDAALSRRLAQAKADGGPDLPLRGQGLAAQGPARPGEDAGAVPPSLQRPGPAPSGRYPARQDLRARALRLHRRVGAERRRLDHRLGVTEAELESYFQSADVFVCASEHEGFCVPLVEAMGHGLPIVAYANSAIPETVADAGLLLPSKEPLLFAASVHRVVKTNGCARNSSRPAAPGRGLLAVEGAAALRRSRGRGRRGTPRP